MESIQHLFVATAQPEFAHVAIVELKRLEPQVKHIEELVPGVILCSASDVPQLLSRAVTDRPIFVRHLAPVQATVALTNTTKDLEEIAVAIVQLPGMALLERGRHFAVQSRFVLTDKSKGERPYSSGQLNQALAEALAEETGAVEHIKKPEVIVSVLCTSQKAYIGISNAEENLSAWPGGARHYAQTTEQISRAEFKLLEALEVFQLELAAHESALDLGAAPGGWTRLLLDADMHVVAVDPAHLDARLTQRKNLEHYRGYAENYIAQALQKRQHFDVIANDMRMDAREASHLLVQAASCLRPDGFILSVLKLPHFGEHSNPLIALKDALHTLRNQYSIVQARQLFHNRQEVTVVAARPLRSSR